MHSSEFDADRKVILESLASTGGAAVTIGTDFAESERARNLAHEHEHVYFCAGIHPVDKFDEIFDYERFVEIASDAKCVGIGECGLDYYWPEQEGWKIGEGEEKERQERLFRNQIKVALELDLPLMIHGRPRKNSMDAYTRIIEILREYKLIHGDSLRGNIHFFVGNKKIAEQFLELGFTMSFTGVITFTTSYDEVIRYIPIDMLHAETDSPWVSPVPHRGERNDSRNVVHVIKRLAELKDVTEAEMRIQLLQNAKRVFGI